MWHLVLCGIQYKPIFCKFPLFNHYHSCSLKDYWFRHLPTVCVWDPGFNPLKGSRTQNFQKTYVHQPTPIWMSFKCNIKLVFFWTNVTCLCWTNNTVTNNTSHTWDKCAGLTCCWLLLTLTTSLINPHEWQWLIFERLEALFIPACIHVKSSSF